MRCLSSQKLETNISPSHGRTVGCLLWVFDYFEEIDRIIGVFVSILNKDGEISKLYCTILQTTLMKYLMGVYLVFPEAYVGF